MFAKSEFSFSFLFLLTTALSISGCATKINSLSSASKAFQNPTGALTLTFSITNLSPTPSNPLSLAYGTTPASYAQYCLLENDTDSSHCAWTGGTLPTIFATATTEGIVVLSAWVKDYSGIVSNRADSNLVTVDRVAPILSTVAVTNTSPTNTLAYALSLGAVTGTYQDYCILENTTSVAACAWATSSVPSAFAVSTTENAKILSLYVRDAAGNVSNRVDSSSVTLDRTNPALSLTSLTGGQVVTGGAATSISWTGSDTNPGATPVALAYSSNSGSTWTSISAGVANSGTYSWTAPSVTSTTYRVRVTFTDAAGNTSTSSSGSDFSINSTTPVIAVTSPNGSEVWMGGSSHNVTWTAAGLPAGSSTAKIEYSINNGVAWTTIIASTANATGANSYSWALPAATNSTQAFVRVSVTDSFSVVTADSSNAAFAIDSTNPTLSLTSLTGGQSIPGGAAASINWTASDTNPGSTPISLEYSANSGSTWTSLATGLTNSGTYSWTTPAVTSTTYRVRVTFTDAAGNISTSASASDFTINSSSPSVAVTSPNGSEVWLGGSVHNVTWTAGGLPGGASTAKLEYSLNNGGAWTTIIASTANAVGANTFSWTLPGATNSVQALVRVSVTDFLSVVTVDSSDSAFAIDSTNPTLSLTSLTGGQTITGGASASVTWTGSDTNPGATPISLEYSSNSGGAWTSIATGLSNSGSYSWTAPSVTSTTYRVRVTFTDAAGNTSTSSSSSDFWINSTTPVVTVTSPNGSEIWKGGSSKNITWTATGLPAGGSSAALAYSLDSGSTWTSIATGQANSGTYAWTLPSSNLGTVKVRVSVTDSFSVVTQDVSDAVFTIDSTSPTLALTTLTGGQAITGGTSNNINWTYSDTNADNGNTALLEVSNDSGSSWSTIASSVANNGSYSWTAPSVTSKLYRVRVTAVDAAGNSSTSASGSDFWINSTTPTVAVTSPNGGEYWAGGAAKNITWTATGLPAGGSTASLEYSTDSGSTWNSIATAQANSGTYAWTVPSLNTATAKVRVSITDSYNVVTSDPSNANFLIDSIAPAISLTAPTNGQSFVRTVATSITWTGSDANAGASPISIEYSGNSGSTWSAVAGPIGNTGTYSWTPTVATRTARIRVTFTDAAGNATTSAMTGDFAVTDAFTQNWAFDAADTASYSYNTGLLDFTGGVCRLKANDQVDDDNSASGFAGGTLTATTWDATNSYVRLSQTGTPTNNAELDSSWTPKWANLVSYWKMNNNWTDSKGSYNGTAQGSMAFTSSAKMGSHAASRTTTADFVDFGSDYTPLNAAQKVTVAGWYKWSSFPEWKSLWGRTLNSTNSFTIFNGGAYGGNPCVTGGPGGQALWIQIANGTDYSACTKNAFLVTNRWYHIAVVFDGSQTGDNNRLKVYIDGVARTDLLGTAAGAALSTLSNFPSTLATVATQPFYIGTGAVGSLTDDVALWTNALTATDVQTLYSRQSATYSGTLASRVMDALATGMSWTKLSWIPTLPFMKELPNYSGSAQNETSTDYSALVGSTGATGDNDLMTGLVGQWHLNETAATAGAFNDFADSSGSGFHGEASSGVTFGVSGRLSKGASFDGTSNARITVTGAAALHPTAAVTFATWVNLGASLLTDTTLPMMSNKEAGGIILQIRSSTGSCPNSLNWSVYIGGAYRCIAIPKTNLVPGRWYHAAGTYDGTTMKLYLDGTLVASSSANTGPIEYTNPTLAFCLGSDPKTGALCDDGIYLDGSLDESGVWNRALHANEIMQLYRRGANRVKQQVRVCTASDCSDDTVGANWKGPDGTNQTYFSELNNNTVPLAITGLAKKGLPSMLFSDFTSPVGTSRYFQYRTVLESDDTGTSCNYGSGATWCSPELKSVTVDPVHYDSSAPTVIGKTGVSYYSLSAMAETLGAACASGIGYNLGVGATFGAATWYWWNGSAWVAASGAVAQSNTAAVITTNAATFGSTVGTGTVYFKAFLKSTGSSACELDNLSLSGQQ